MLNKNNIKDIYPLTPLQEGIYFHAIYEKSPVYFCQNVYQVEGALDVEKFKEAFGILIERYDQLRSVFVNRSGKLMQIILQEVQDVFEYHDISNLDDWGSYLEKFKAQDIEKSFDLEKEIPLRISVFRIGEDKYEFIWSHHHIIMDGWCISIIVSDFLEIYNALTQQRPFSLSEVIPFSVYHKWLKSTNPKDAEAYWQKYLNDFSQTTFLSKSVNNREAYEGVEWTVNIGRKATKELLELVKASKSTLNILVQAVWGILLSKYTDRNDVVFGSIVSGRPAEIEDVERILGLFINAVPTRIQYNHETLFTDLLANLHQNHIRSEPYHYYSLADIQANSEINGQLFDHLFVFENYPSLESLEGDKDSIENRDKVELKFIGETEVVEQNNYNFNVLVHARNEELVLNYKYNARVYTDDFVKRLSDHVTNILKTIIKKPTIRVSEIDILTKAENERLSLLNNNTYSYPKAGSTVVDVFCQNAASHPDRVAIIYKDLAITYNCLHKLSGKLAVLIYKKTKGTASIIPLMVERCPEMIIGILGILKAGSAYLPIHPSLPKKRIQFLLEDASSDFALSTTRTKSMGISNLECIDIDQIRFSKSGFQNPILKKADSRLAYVIYTSGSTGQPKGVMIDHRALLNRLNWMQKKYPIHEGDVILQKTPFTFDVSVWELIWWSIVGATVSLMEPEGEKDPNKILRQINRDKVTTMHFVPSMLSEFLTFIELNPINLSSLNRVFCSGEALTNFQLIKFNELIRPYGVSLSNLYGPTEACIDVSYFDCPNEHLDVVPIGSPIDNIHLFVLDRNGNQQPMDVEGELFIGGLGLAKGYMNRPQLTQEKFYFHANLGKRIYKTGDRAKWAQNGQLIYLGREDNQVKIRGMRVELQEIERTILKYPSMRETIIAVLQNGRDDSYLNAYFVANDKIEIDQLKAYLRDHLPDHMIPFGFMQLDKFPTTKHGKINRRNLPVISLGLQHQSQIRQPVDKVQINLQKLWAKVLNLEEKRIGLESNFFEVGGHSLKAIRLLSLIQKDFGLNFDIQQIFTNPILEDMAKQLKALMWVNKPDSSINFETKKIII